MSRNPSAPSPLLPAIAGIDADNVGFVEELYATYLRDPALVPADWRGYFDAAQSSSGDRAAGERASAASPSTLGSDDLRLALAALRLVEAFRSHGHLGAHVDPLSPPPALPAVLDPSTYGVTSADLGREVATGGALGVDRLPLGALIDGLKAAWSGPLGLETAHIEDADTRRWLIGQMESPARALDGALQRHLLSRLTDAETFERFLGTKFLKEKRFSVEGGEGFIPALDAVIDEAAEAGVQGVVIGMAHRGRLNVLVNVLRKPESELFRGFLKMDPAPDGGPQARSGDVKYHLGYENDVRTRRGRDVHLSLAFNPSHLEAVYPVIEGRVRAMQDRFGDTARAQVLPIVVHGDASMPGQGIVTECLNYSQLPGYTVGGTIHFVINNQVGFTTGWVEARSSRYCTSFGRALDIPILHVHGERPEALWRAAAIATAFRQQFQRDAIIDLVCYRKHGHNEGDEPGFTQPVMYRAISKRSSAREQYAAELVRAGVVTDAEAQQLVDARKEHLEKQLDDTKSGVRRPHDLNGPAWNGYVGGADDESPAAETGLSRSVLEPLMRRLVELPEGFEPHPTLQKFVLKQRLEMAEGARKFDWGGAENLAFASLLAEGTRIRLTGQDAKRGTFSHRHAVYFDHQTNVPASPLQRLGGAPFEVHNSSLSEYAVMGFDYGYSLEWPDALVMWEAQFGDFVNGAQIIVDQFLSSSEDKWDRLSGLVLLLPHGFEGQGPEHSSARLERFLQNSANDNWQVCNFTSPANYFHALRRQVHRRIRKPLVVVTPKSLLRHPQAVSTYEEFEGGFQKVIGDTTVDPARVRRAVVCSGKVYFDLADKRAQLGNTETAIIRLEQLYPYPARELAAELGRYPNLRDLVWAQEEPWNMGAWFYIHAREPLPGLPRFRCVSRAEAASPASGFAKIHEHEQQHLLEQAFAEWADVSTLRRASGDRDS